MTQEEKAKAYNEALELARKELQACGSQDCDAARQIFRLFPELHESENERIRKELIEFVKSRGGFKQEYITWIEKQGGIDNCPLEYSVNTVMTDSKKNQVEPKFKIGDWVVYNRNNSSREILQVYDIRDDRYYFTDNVHLSWSIKECDEKCHFWTIQDTRDGDVLKEDSCIFIIERMKPNGTAIVHCCLFDDGDFDSGFTLGFDVNNTYPATKEQCELLFQKIKEEGYEWDANKKQLKKSEQKPIDKFESKFKVGDWVVCEVTGSVYQIKNCIEGLSNHKYGYILTNGGYIGSDEINHYHLWTIQDAKDGDIIAEEPFKPYTSPFVAIYKKQNEEDFDSYCFIGFNGKFYEGEEGHSIENIHPATKEQHNILFQKMKKAGYEWNAEKKELKLLITNGGDFDV